MRRRRKGGEGEEQEEDVDEGASGGVYITVGSTKAEDLQWWFLAGPMGS